MVRKEEQMMVRKEEKKKNIWWWEKKKRRGAEKWITNLNGWGFAGGSAARGGFKHGSGGGEPAKRERLERSVWTREEWDGEGSEVRATRYTVRDDTKGPPTLIGNSGVKMDSRF